MNMDLYNNYLGQFISHYAGMLFAERQAAERGIDLNDNPLWKNADFQRQRLKFARAYVLENPVMGTAKGSFATDDLVAPTTGLKVTPERLRAMAHDASTLADIAMGETNPEAWWYDPSTPDGITSHFPGGSDNPDCV